MTGLSSRRNILARDTSYSSAPLPFTDLLPFPLSLDISAKCLAAAGKPITLLFVCIWILQIIKRDAHKGMPQDLRWTNASTSSAQFTQ